MVFIYVFTDHGLEKRGWLRRLRHRTDTSNSVQLCQSQENDYNPTPIITVNGFRGVSSFKHVLHVLSQTAMVCIKSWPEVWPPVTINNRLWPAMFWRLKWTTKSTCFLLPSDDFLPQNRGCVERTPKFWLLACRSRYILSRSIRIGRTGPMIPPNHWQWLFLDPLYVKDPESDTCRSVTSEKNSRRVVRMNSMALSLRAPRPSRALPMPGKRSRLADGVDLRLLFGAAAE